ncbi:hypothetical protein CCMA1212_004529 [Trichoderma ghanense]|uniref:Uncharacterized protein n=1 Tax=Trichoderma ghanense TaxID=65468 RepID=A0ABY2H512_9HYPO
MHFYTAWSSIEHLTYGALQQTRMGASLNCSVPALKLEPCERFSRASSSDMGACLSRAAPLDGTGTPSEEQSKKRAAANGVDKASRAWQASQISPGFKPGSGWASLDGRQGTRIMYERDDNDDAVEDENCSNKTWDTWDLSHGRTPSVLASGTRCSGGGGGGSSSINDSNPKFVTRRLHPTGNNAEAEAAPNPVLPICCLRLTRPEGVA